MASQSNFMIDFNSTTGSPVSQGNKIPRSTLACLPCRSRHLKCDGQQPHCSRCAEAGKQCSYAKSRRGGLDRAALAERRKRLAAVEVSSAPDAQVRSLSPQIPEQRTPGAQSFQFAEADGYSLLNGINVTGSTSSPETASTPPVHLLNIENDSLLDMYYKNFHKFHPVALPRRHLNKLYLDPNKNSSLIPVVAVMRLIGNLYRSREWSTALSENTEACLREASQTDPFTVQCRTLYSIALFWSRFQTESKRELDAAIRIAYQTEIYRYEFTLHHGEDDPVLTECLRRTWWMLYIIDAYYAGTLGTMDFAFSDIEPTVELPCEESEYESGEIPEPNTLQEFDHREFALENIEFSSFAYLIGAVRSTELATMTAPRPGTSDASPQTIQAADSILDGWLLLLPKKRRQIMSKNGEVDELMFQALLLIHVAIVGLHRPLSDLKFNVKESISTCARDPPPETPTPELVNIHTVRILRSVEAQIRLLALPSRPFNHTPFSTCMVSEGTLALLSACKFLLKGKDLAIARDQLRMIIGCLRSLGEIWARTAKNVQEIQIIARHVFGLESDKTTTKPPLRDETLDFSGGDGQTNFGSGSETSSDNVFSTLGDMDNLCGWYNLGDQEPELSWMMTE